MSAADGYLTVEDIHARTGESPDTIRRRCHAGQIPAKKLGKRWFVSTENFERFMEPGFTPSPRNRLTEKQRKAIGLA